jgi:hypothetical protein
LVRSGPSDIVIDSTIDRDSVVQFIAACQGDDFDLTLSTVLEMELLCDERPVVRESIRKKVTEFIENKGFWLRRLFFHLERGLISSEAEDLLRRNPPGFVGDSAALEIPAAVLCRVIDFRDCEGRSDESGRLFGFCVEYLRKHGSSASRIMRTLDVTLLSNEDLGRLCAIRQLNWGVLNESVVQSLLALQNEVERQRKEIGDLRKEVVEQRQDFGKLEGERNAYEGAIAKQASEMECLKNEKKKCEYELKRSTGALR